MRERSWRSVRLATISRALGGGWEWAGDLRFGSGGRALRSPRGVLFEIRWHPLAARRFVERRFADAA